MGKRKRQVYSEELNIWPSFTDLMANAFMILSLFLLLALFKSLFLKYTADETEEDLIALQQEVTGLQNQLQQRTNRVTQLERERGSLRDQLQQNRNQVNQLQSEVQRLKSAPPVVVIENSGEYQFESGSAELPNQLKSYIATDLVGRIEAITRSRNIYVVEIIGHTDGQINNTRSNLDSALEEVASGRKPVNILTAGSNADLGLMRALEVAKELQEIQKTGRLAGLEFRAYSAAQLLLPNGNFAPVDRNPDKNRRRIEIRFSPLGEAETIR